MLAFALCQHHIHKYPTSLAGYASINHRVSGWYSLNIHLLHTRIVHPRRAATPRCRVQCRCPSSHEAFHSTSNAMANTNTHSMSTINISGYHQPSSSSLLLAGASCCSFSLRRQLLSPFYLFCGDKYWWHDDSTAWEYIIGNKSARF